MAEGLSGFSTMQFPLTASAHITNERQAFRCQERAGLPENVHQNKRLLKLVVWERVE